METKSHVYIVDDQSSVRESLVAVVNLHGDQPHAFPDAETLLASAPFSRPACLIVDLHLPQIDGEQLQAQLSEEVNSPPLIMISGCATVASSVRLMERGAMTLLEKPIEPSTLLDYVEKAILVDRWQLELRARYADLERRFLAMTARQSLTLDFIVDGVPSKTIAKQQDVSQRTVEIDRSRLMTLFGVDSTPELVAKATEFRVLKEMNSRTNRIFRKHAASLLTDGTDTSH